MVVKATQLRPGMIIRHDNELYTVFSVDHRTPGNKRAAMATKMRNLRSGSIIDYRFRAEEFLERAIVDEIEHQFMYADGDSYNFMNTENYEQVTLNSDVLGDAVYYLINDMLVKIEYYDGKAIGVEVPDTVDLTVVDTEPTVQKATASAVMKAAKLETGLTIQVPPFVNNGDGKGRHHRSALHPARGQITVPSRHPESGCRTLCCLRVRTLTLRLPLPFIA